VTDNSFFALVLFVCVSGFALYMVFLRRVLRELDPSQVVPERVKHAFDALAEGVLIIDERGDIVLANDAFHESVAATSDSLMGLNAGSLNWTTYQTDAALRPEKLPWSKVLKLGEGVIGKKISIHYASDLERSFAVNCTPILDDKKNVRGVITTFDDITELERKNEKLRKTLDHLKQTKHDVDMRNKELHHLATRDALTNILNRRSFNEAYEREFQEASEQGNDLVCMMIDIDHFKRINDNYGHGVGDKVIRFVADALGKEIRSGDILGRYGGEEYCVVLPNSSASDAVSIAERMRERIVAGDPEMFTSAIRITASIGLCSIESESNSKDDLLNKADRALYLAKESGRNKVLVWEEQQEPESSNVVELSEQRINRDAAESSLVGEPTSQELDASARIAQLEKIAEEKAKQLDEYVAYDPLTHLPERSLFLDRVEQALARARREGSVMAVLSLGLQNLKRVNDTLGYDSAREFLTQTADRLRGALREPDAISVFSNDASQTSISKLNESEFGILLPAVKDSESIAWIVKRVFDVLHEPMYINDHNILINMTMGIGVYPTDGQTAGDLIRQASVARYYAEQQPGINNVEYFSPDINRIANEQLRMESQMSTAIENEEFRILYQPKISLGNGEISGFEALIRWEHPTQGLLAPNEFIDIAERTRLINLIGDWVLVTACRQVKEFSEIAGRDLSCAVNVSPVQLSQPDLAERFIRMIQEEGANPELIELELTENCLLENLDQTYNTLAKLQSYGINISIDDFGTGYSGLSYLRTLPINILKVDRCFVADISSNDHDRAIVKAIVSMAQALDLRVIAEGIESRKQLEMLSEMGCEEAQGYFFGRPSEPDVAKGFLMRSQEVADAV
ncbi:MAG: EAL domain-containing protein, partial [Halioglobus sp.]